MTFLGVFLLSASAVLLCIDPDIKDVFAAFLAAFGSVIFWIGCNDD